MSADDVRLRIEGKTAGTLSFEALGHSPYILVTGTVDQDDDATVFDVEVGGGLSVNVEELAQGFELLAVILRDGTVTASSVPDVQVADDECQAGS